VGTPTAISSYAVQVAPPPPPKPPAALPSTKGTDVGLIVGVVLGCTFFIVLILVFLGKNSYAAGAKVDGNARPERFLLQASNEYPLVTTHIGADSPKKGFISRFAGGRSLSKTPQVKVGAGALLQQNEVTMATNI